MGSTRLTGIPGSDSHLELIRMYRDPVRFFHERFERFGPVFRSRFVYPVVFLIGAEANHSIMITRRHDFSYELGYGQLALGRVFARSIMLMDGDEHKHTRELLTPAVGRLAVADSAARVHAIWSAAAARFAGRDAVDAYKDTERITFEVAANTISGLELGPETDRFRTYFERLIDGTLAATPIRFPLGTLDRGLRARETLVEMLRPRVEAARAVDSGGLLGQLARADLPTEEIAAHLLMLMWAAYDTTASATSWVLHVLARRPDWQDRLRRELRDQLAGAPITADNANQLVQMTWFLRETERMYPSVLFFPRVTVEDFELFGYRIPKGTSAYYSPYMSHRDPASFPNPNAFDPDRWDPERPGGAPKASALVGFGGGPRVCLGKAFAQLQLRIMIDCLLRGHRIEPDPTCKPRIQGIPVHHPNDSRVRLRKLDAN